MQFKIPPLSGDQFIKFCPMSSLRCCISCRLMADKSEFWRVVRTAPDRQIQINSGMGRSAYLCKTETCLLAAEKKDRLSRALKTSVPKETYQKLRQMILLGSADR